MTWNSTIYMGRDLLLTVVVFGGRADFSDASIEKFNFQGWTSADGEVLFRRSQFNNLTLSRVAFRKDVDFEGARICSQITFRNVTFEGDLHFEDAVFPWMNQPCGLKSDSKRDKAFFFADTTLNKGLYSQPDQLLIPPYWWAFWKGRSPRFTSGDFSEVDDDETFPADVRLARANAARAKERRLWRELER